MEGGSRRFTLTYRFDTTFTPVVQMRVKVESNTREHFAVHGFTTRPLVVSNPWFSGAAEVSTFTLSELLGTKLRALYQRKKGRDLFDLTLGLDHPETEPALLVVVRDLGGVHALVPGPEVPTEGGRELEPVRRAARALEDAGGRLAGVGEGLALMEGDVEQPLPAPAERQADVLPRAVVEEVGDLVDDELGERVALVEVPGRDVAGGLLADAEEAGRVRAEQRGADAVQVKGSRGSTRRGRSSPRARRARPCPA